VAGGWWAWSYRCQESGEQMNLYAFAGLGVFDMADIYGPAEEIYGMFCQQYCGSKPVRGFTKFVPRYGGITAMFVTVMP
jgi:aryl-alcohol dehydrogenase-like predicted oxidoreductase